MYNKIKEIVVFLFNIVFVSGAWLAAGVALYIIKDMFFCGELEYQAAPEIFNRIFKISGIIICYMGIPCAICGYCFSVKQKYGELRASLNQIKETASKMEKKNKSFSEMNLKEKCAYMYGLTILTDTQLNFMSIEDKNNYNERIELAAETQCVHIAFIVVLILGVFKYFIL